MINLTYDLRLSECLVCIVFSKISNEIAPSQTFARSLLACVALCPPYSWLVWIQHCLRVYRSSVRVKIVSCNSINVWKLAKGQFSVRPCRSVNTGLIWDESFVNMNSAFHTLFVLSWQSLLEIFLSPYFSYSILTAQWNRGLPQIFLSIFLYTVKYSYLLI